MNATVKVYSKPMCVQCTATYRSLDKTGVAYDVIDASEDDVARDFVMELGHKQSPVVVVTDASGNRQHWSGFRPDHIKEFIAPLQASA